jgi:hypothetical protein
MYINSTRLLTDHVIAERVFKETHAHGTLAFAYRQSIKMDIESRKPTGDQLRIIITAVLAVGTGGRLEPFPMPAEKIDLLYNSCTIFVSGFSSIFILNY